MTGKFLSLAKQVSAASSGAFDITVGPLVRAWGGRGPVPRQPSHEELRALRPLIDWQAIEVASGQCVVWHARLLRTGMRLDPGALGKGFAVDLAIERLRQEGITSALVDFSGNMYALGSPPSRLAWEVAVCDPVRPSAILGVVALRDQAIASSGGYTRHGLVGKARSCHIVSPLTLEPVMDVLGTTVVAPTAALADGFSTAAFVLGRNAVGVLEAQPGVDGFVVWNGRDGVPEQATTRGWRIES